MILIGIGSNLSRADGTPPLETCRHAAARLDALPGLRLRALSRWYLTNPVPPSGQPAYVNAVAMLRVEVPAMEPDPGVLLAALQAIEASASRVRSSPNAARTLDLDIIAMGQGGRMVRDAPDPILPHPRAHLRAFVLVPLLDVAPEWMHPVLGRTAGELLRELPEQGVRELPGNR
jgi:2-amino-4-hydroxy-6-hydroxymethyldihydropteridine diphosphokinase